MGEQPKWRETASEQCECCEHRAAWEATQAKPAGLQGDWDGMWSVCDDHLVQTLKLISSCGIERVVPIVW